ncbi:hypothetical protein [Rickettsia massiliae]|uniref:hypothetical protein n=1 Tax=Rickettsia massiliae TaxID=35791 RepID=UPI0002F94612|nr:hypothetical protein [Rickettsia massiliae]
MNTSTAFKLIVVPLPVKLPLKASLLVNTKVAPLATTLLAVILLANIFTEPGDKVIIPLLLTLLAKLVLLFVVMLPTGFAAVPYTTYSQIMFLSDW